MAEPKKEFPGNYPKKLLSTLFAAIFATLLTGASFGQTSKPAVPQQTSPVETVQPLSIATTTLANGLQVVVYEDHTVPIVTVEYANKAGSAVEPPDQSGFSHLMEHLFFKSNQAMKDQAPYLADVEKSGAMRNGSTKEEVFSAYVTVTSNYLPVVFQYLRDAIRRPLFLPEEVQQAKSEVLRELDRRSLEAYAQLNVQLNSDLYYKYTSRKTPVGSSVVVESVTPEQLRSFWAKYWVPENSVFVITGDITPAAAFMQAEQLFGDWKATQQPAVSPAQIPEHPPMQRSSARILEGVGSTVLIGVAWQGPSTGKDINATYAADVFSGIVNQPGSRLQRSLVDSGLARAVTMNYYTQRNVGMISMMVLTTPDKVRDALKTMNSEISHLTDKDYFTVEEMGNARQILAVQELFGREKPTEFAHDLSYWWASAGIETYRTYQGSLSKVTEADVRRYLENYIAGKPRVVAVLLAPEAQQTLHLTSDEMAKP